MLALLHASSLITNAPRGNTRRYKMNTYDFGTRVLLVLSEVSSVIDWAGFLHLI